MLSPSRFIPACLLTALLAFGSTACGGSALRDEDDLSAAGSRASPAVSAGPGSEHTPTGADKNGERVGAAAAFGSGGASNVLCPPGLPSAAEIAATPRADENLELLALRLSGGIVADQATYDRIVRDVSAVRAQDERVATIAYFPQSDGKSIGLSPDQQTDEAMRSGQYQGWNCLNQAYVVTDTHFDDANPPFDANVYLELKGIYDISKVVMQYGQLPGVKAFNSGPGGGDGPTICVTRESDIWHYVFDQAGGDCPAGCTEHTYYHFSTNVAGSVTTLGQIPADTDSKYTSPEACR